MLASIMEEKTLTYEKKNQFINEYAKAKIHKMNTLIYEYTIY